MTIDKTKEVLTEDGKVESFTLTVGGKPFRCECGANCFHKPYRTNLNVYRCNGCNKTYEAY